MTNLTRFLILLVLALLGLVVGLGWHIGAQAWQARDTTRQQADQRAPTPVFSLIEGSCGSAELRLREGALDKHLANLGQDLQPPQQALAGELVLSRAKVICTVRQTRAALRQRDARAALEDPETAKSFLRDLIDLRRTLIEASLEETRLQGDLLDSLSPEQLQNLSAQNLPNLIPGLSLRDFQGIEGGSQRPNRPQREER